MKEWEWGEDALEDATAQVELEVAVVYVIRHLRRRMTIKLRSVFSQLCLVLFLVFVLFEVFFEEKKKPPFFYYIYTGNAIDSTESSVANFYQQCKSLQVGQASASAYAGSKTNSTITDED
jgi:hypothetical protein